MQIFETLARCVLPLNGVTDTVSTRAPTNTNRIDGYKWIMLQEQITWMETRQAMITNTTAATIACYYYQTAITTTRNDKG